MMAEMRGDMPGNYFSWMLRYPEQDDAIIVLRNAYGSTEHLEDNLQAILFNQPPGMPFRNIKDLAAACWLVPASSISSHLALSAVVFLLLAGSLGLAVRVRKKRTG